MLVKFINKQKHHWEDFLDACLYAYNTARHASSHYTPFELMFSRRAVLPVDFGFEKAKAADILLESLPKRQRGIINMQAWFVIMIIYSFIQADASIDIERRVQVLQQAKNNIILAQEKQKQAYDRKHSCPEVFEVKALVLKKDFTRKKRKGGKLDPKWVGPYRIIRKLGRGLYRLRELSDPTKVVSRVNGVHLKKYIMPEVIK